MTAYFQPDLTIPERRPPPPAADELPAEVVRVVDYLVTHCRGPERALTAREIGEAVGFQVADPARKVRQLVAEYLDRFPVIVCGSPGTGLFVTEDPEHLQHWERTQWATMRTLYHHIKRHRHLARRLGYRIAGHHGAVTYSAPLRSPSEAGSPPA